MFLPNQTKVLCKINQNNPSNINAFQQSPTFSKCFVISNEACQTRNCVTTAEIK